MSTRTKVLKKKTHFRNMWFHVEVHDGANSYRGRHFISRPDTVSILIYDTDLREFAITRRFRPGRKAGLLLMNSFRTLQLRLLVE